MSPELRKMMTERYVSWAEAWGMSLAFAVTQNLEKSERIVADAVVALIAAETEAEARLDPQAARAKGSKPLIPSSVTAARFASVLWELSNKQAFRGFGADAFFRMPAIARAIVVLKLRAQLSRQQIGSVLNVSLKQVDDHLENARLLFSDGRSWLAPPVGALAGDATNPIHMQGDQWVPDCPQWRAEAPGTSDETTGAGLQDTFAQYVGNDLDTETGRKLHSHLVVCTTCRTSFSNFKRQYADWTQSIPSIDPNDEMRKHLTKVTRMAFKTRRGGPPSPFPGLKRVLRDAQMLTMLGGAAALFLLKLFMDRQ